jgi:hypothetical protein
MRWSRMERDRVFLRGRLRRRWRRWLRRRRSWLRGRWRSWHRGRFRCGERSRLRSGFWSRFRRIAMLLRMIRRCNLRKRTRIHPDDIAGRPPDLSSGEVKQRRNEQDVKGGDVNQIPPKVRVTHESDKEIAARMRNIARRITRRFLAVPPRDAS